MTPFEVRLKILLEIILKKRDALNAILNICENEETVILNNGHHDEILTSLAAEKQKHITTVLESDELFQSSYDSVRDVFESRAKEYKDDAVRLKGLINEVCGLDMKIRLREGKNRKLLNNKKAPKALTLPSARVAALYAKGAKAKS